MGNTTVASNSPVIRVQWMWNASTDPFTKSQPGEWQRYSDVENLIIEEAFIAGQIHAMLDNYHIDFQHNLQISNNDANKQRPVKRTERNENDICLREERFLPNPIAPDLPYGGQYGFISPFIKEVVKDLNLTTKHLPSKDKKVVQIVVEKAVLGIIEEGKKLGKQCEAEKMAQNLMEKKTAGMEEVWKYCAYLYSVESFLYKKLNEVMRLIGSEEHEQVWRSKLHTLGPFCLLLWDNPFSSRLTKPGTVLFRGAKLSDDLIASFSNDCSTDPKPWHSFQAFTSCTRNRSVAEKFGNVLFIMKIRLAFTIDLTEFSAYAHEEEELLLPGVSFTIDRVEFDKDKDKHLVYLTLQQRHNRTEHNQISANTATTTQTKKHSKRDNRRDIYHDADHADLFHLYDYDTADDDLDRLTDPDNLRALDRYVVPYLLDHDRLVHRRFHRFGYDDEWK